MNQNTENFSCPHHVVASFIVLNLLSYPLNRYTTVIDDKDPSRPLFPPPKEDKSGRIDYFFGLHLAVGIMWLLVGFIQIYQAKLGGWSLSPNTNWKAHRMFGKVVIVIVIAHICIMGLMALENPVNQHRWIRFAYTGMVYHALSILLKGVEYARKTARSSPLKVENENQTNEKIYEHRLNRTKHGMYMFFLYTRTTMGSGTIRVTAWVLWLVGQFLK